MTDAVKILVAGGTKNWIELAKLIRDLDAQGFLDGNWVPAASKVVDLIGKRMAADIA